METNDHSVVWRILCWAALAGALYLYFDNRPFAAIAVGGIAIALFFIDYKASVLIKTASPDLSDSDPIVRLRKLIRGAFVAVLVIAASQLVVNSMHNIG
jgi:hypothetical protein